MHKVKLYYDCSWADIERIKQRFGITCGTTINYETCQPIEVSDDDWPLLLETQRRGYIKIRKEYDCNTTQPIHAKSEHCKD